MSIQVRPERRLLPDGPARRRLLVEIRAPQVTARAARPPLNLALVLDRSGSMAGDKLRLTLEAAQRSLESLRATDLFSVVLYNEAVSVLSAALPVTAHTLEDMSIALRSVTAQGNTDLSAGWLSGCAQLGAVLGADALARCFLVSDGLANRGIVDVEELVRHASELRRRGVTTSTLGVGEDFDEDLLRRLADAGGGHFYFAQDAEAIPGFVAAEVGQALDTIAREVVLSVHVDASVHVTCLNGEPGVRAGDTLRFALGSLPAGGMCTRVLQLDFPPGPFGAREPVVLALSDRDGVFDGSTASCSWNRVDAEACAQEAADSSVLRQALSLETAQARLRALDALREYDHDGAVRLIREQAARVRAQAAGDTPLLRLADELEQETRTYLTPTGKIAMKGRTFAAHRVLKGAPVVAPLAWTARPRLHLTWFEGELADSVSQAYEVMARHAVAWKLDLTRGAAPIEAPPGERLLYARERELVRAVSRAPTLTIAVTTRGLEDNWFSHWHAQERVVLLSVHGWHHLSQLPIAALVAYETLLHGLRAVSQQYDPAELIHEETRGCLFDFCAQKAEVEIKLQVGHICEPCISQLLQLNIEARAVSRVWSSIQQLAHSRQP